MHKYPLLCRADVFIGSCPHVYVIVASLRAAYGRGSSDHTCFIDKTKSWFPLICESSKEVSKMWVKASGGGYVGGTPLG